MDSKNSVKKGMVDHYVNGHLNAEEAAAFESHFLDQPEVIGELEISQLLRTGLQLMPEAAQDSVHTRWWQRLFELRGSSGWVTAFATMTVVVCAQFFYFNNQIRQLSAPQPNTPVLVLGQTRGGPATGVLYLDDSIRWFALEVELDWPQAEAYSLEVSDGASGQTVVAVDQLGVSSNDSVLVSLPARSFHQGEYDVSVRDAKSTVASFKLRVVRRSMH